jgi:D-3-phosphoglycerate dehydrogenase
VLAASHNLVAKDRLLRLGEWSASQWLLGHEPRGKTVGTIGLGNIAREALRLLRPFDVARFVAFDPLIPAASAAEMGVELLPLDELLATSDYVLVNCPLTPETRKLVGARELRLMKKDAILVNTARGPIVDQDALVEVLREGHLRCAALDVFEQEPLPADSPLIGIANTILTSHSLCWSEELFRDMGREAFGGVLAVRKGEAPRHVVNAEVLERPGFRRKLERFRDAAA